MEQVNQEGHLVVQILVGYDGLRDNKGGNREAVEEVIDDFQRGVQDRARLLQHAAGSIVQ